MKIIEHAPGHISIVCETCNEPIAVSNEDGMFCKNLHGLAESQAAKAKLEGLLTKFHELFAPEED